MTNFLILEDGAGLSQVGVSLKSQYYNQVLAESPEIGWFEVHSENYLAPGGPSRARLLEIAKTYPISLHGVSLSLGSADSLDQNHLQNLKALIAEVQPRFVSEHLAWSRLDGVYLNDLLPLPYTEESLDIMCRHVDETQTFLGREIFVENPSAYLAFKGETLDEPTFLTRMVEKTGCKLLLDVNNIYVSGNNNGFDPASYLESLPQGIIGEIHLAGHHQRPTKDTAFFCIDDHGSRVSEDVWHLYHQAIDRFGPLPTLIEWDTDIPPLSILLEEAHKAAEVLHAHANPTERACA